MLPPCTIQAHLSTTLTCQYASTPPLPCHHAVSCLRNAQRTRKRTSTSARDRGGGGVHPFDPTPRLLNCRTYKAEKHLAYNTFHHVKVWYTLIMEQVAPAKLNIHGDPLRSLMSRSRPSKTPGSSCIIYLGRIDSHGYGVTRANGKLVAAHRFSYEAHFGLIPQGFHVHHTCQTRACVNPRHLVALHPDDHQATHNPPDDSPCRTCGAPITRTESGKRRCYKCAYRPVYGPPVPRRNEGPCLSCGEEDFYRNANGKRLCRSCRRRKKAAQRKKNQQSATS